jgi:acetyl-CoA acetyltransferase
MSDVYIIGVGMTPVGRHLDKSVKDLTAIAVHSALSDANLTKDQIQAAWFTSTFWGYFEGQEAIRGQVALRPMGISGIPIVNVENGCASGSTTVHSAWMAVKAGMYDCALCVGMEKMYYPSEPEKMFASFDRGVDYECLGDMLKQFQEIKTRIKIDIPKDTNTDLIPGKTKSALMDCYAGWALWHMDKYGTTQRQLAAVSAKNHRHGATNMMSQIKKAMTIEEVLNDKVVQWPLTRSMCAPIGDCSAAAIICSEQFLRKHGIHRAIKIRASVLSSGTDRDWDGEDIAARTSKRAYDYSGVGPQDINVAEMHDACAYGELHQAEAVGFCPEGQGGPFAESGATTLGGKIPINPSGGLECRGHAIAASGLAQIYELVLQLRGEAGNRQVERARIAMQVNGGGIVNLEEASMIVHIFEKQ